MTRPRLAVVTPLPPARTGVARYEAVRLAALARLADVDVFVDGDRADAPEPVAGVRLRDIHELEDAPGEGYAAPVLHILGESPHHAFALTHLLGSGGDVLLHDVRLRGLWDALAAFGRIPSEERDAALADDPAGLACGPVIDRARRVLVHGEAARRLALTVRPDRAGDILAIPYASERAAAPRAPREPALVCAFGHPRDAPLFIHALAATGGTDVRGMIVGEPTGQGERERLLELARDAGVGDRVTVTGWVPDSEWERLLATATVAVQLRAGWGGETSGTIADCLAAGVPTIATAGAAAGGLEHAVVPVPASSGPGTLAAAITDLLGDPARRAALEAAGRELTAAATMEIAATSLLEAVLAPPSGARG